MGTYTGQFGKGLISVVTCDGGDPDGIEGIHRG
jgi:hypothetical protein